VAGFLKDSVKTRFLKDIAFRVARFLKDSVAGFLRVARFLKDSVKTRFLKDSAFRVASFLKYSVERFPNRKVLILN